MTSRRRKRELPRDDDSPSRRYGYDGRAHLGHVIRRGDDFLAHDRRGEPVGAYDTFGEAADAIMRRAARDGTP